MAPQLRNELAAVNVASRQLAPEPRRQWDKFFSNDQWGLGTLSIVPGSDNVDELLADIAWVRRLATALVSDSADAEDVAQLAFVAAIETPPATPGKLRPWLLVVTRNIARMAGRTNRRRRERESSTVSEAVPSPETLAERAELQRKLATYLTELAEPYRSTILLRYFEDLDPSEIARRLGIPAGTVRWRLKYGLDELRARLDDAHRARRKAWLVPMSGFLRLSRSVPPTATAPNALASSTLAKAVLMKATTKLIVVLAVCLMLLGALMLRRHSVHHAALPPSRHAERQPTPPSANRRLQFVQLPSAKITRAKPPATLGGFGGRVLSSATGQPIRGAALTFLVRGAAVSTQANDDGRYEIASNAIATYELESATAEGFLPFEPEFGHSPVLVSTIAGVHIDDVTIFLTPASRITVVIQDISAKPIVRAQVRAISPQGLPTAGPAITNDRGETQLAVGPPQTIEARKQGYRRASHWIDRAGAARRVILTLERGADPSLAAIAGRVVDKSGMPVEGALVEAYRMVPSDEPDRAAGLTNVDGKFALSDLTPETYRVRAMARGQGAVELRDVAAGRNDVELRLGSPNGGLHGIVRGSDGQPVPAFSVVAWPKEGLLGRGVPVRTSVVSPDGRYDLLLPVGTYVVAAAARDYAPSSESTTDVTKDGTQLDFTLDRGSRLFGRVIERGTGAAIASAHVGVTSSLVANSVTFVNDVMTGDDGSFAFQGVRPGRTSIQVQAPGHNGRILGGLDVPQSGDLGPITVDLSAVRPGEEPKTELVGIAATLSATPQGMVVTAVLPGGGAADAGLQPGDVVQTIDGQDAAQAGFNGSIQLLRGAEGTVVVLSVKHADGSTAVIPVVRKRVNF